MSRLETIAIVPVKALADAKSRLADALEPQARRRLVLAMLEDVLAAIAVAPAVTRSLVVTPDPDVAAAARACGTKVVVEPAPTSLNGAIRIGLHHGSRQPETRCLVLPADVPLATPSEIMALLAETAPSEQAPPARVVIAPSQDGGGTNALLLMDHDLMGPSFGPDSFRRHLELAQALGLNPRVVRLPGLGFDIDTPADLRRLSKLERYRWLNDVRLPEPQPS